MAEKVTTMKLKVDLQCKKCYKKVKKVLCKFPQIRDQVYDEKNNIVTINVVCCDPEKIRDMLCRKGCGCIKSIEIVEPPKPKPPPEKPKPEKPKPPPPPPPKPAEPAPPPPPPPPKPVEPAPPPPPPPKPAPPRVCCGPCSEGRPGGPCFLGYGGPPPRVCCGPCSEGRPGGPCFLGYGPPPCYGVYYGRPVYDSYGGGPCYVSRCDLYCCEENPSACTIM